MTNALRPFRRHVAAFALLAGGALGGVGLLNAVVNPFGQFPSAARASYADHTPVADTRTFKAERLRHEQFHLVIIGDSTAEVGFDPGWWKGESVYNAALPGANLYELRHVAKLVADHHSAKRVLWVLYWNQFSDKYTVRNDFDKSGFYPKRGRVEHTLEGLLGLRATEASWGALGLARRNGLPVARRDGWRQRIGAKEAAMSPRERFDGRARQRFGDDGKLFDPARLTYLREALTTLRDANVEVTIVIPPVHAESLEIIHLNGQWEQWEALVRGTAETVSKFKGVALWSFAGYSPETTEPVAAKEMEGYWEMDHFKAALGEGVAKRVGGSDGFGMRLEPGTVDSYLSALREAAAQWRRENPAAVTHLETLHERRTTTGTATSSHAAP